MISKRWYQAEASDAFFKDARAHPSASQLLVLPTGAGKTVVMGDIISRVVGTSRRVLVLARSKELVNQNFSTFLRMFPDLQPLAGICCGGLSRTDVAHPIIFGTVQTVINRCDDLGKRKLVIVDEAHQIPQDDQSQYQQVLSCLRSVEPKVKMLGLTASPYRLDGGIIFGPGQQFDRVSYVVKLRTLMDEGYITKPKTLQVSGIDLSMVTRRGADFAPESVAANTDLGRVMPEIIAAAKSKDAKGIMVFANSIEQGLEVERYLSASGEDVRFVHGETPALWRDSMISEFKSQDVRWIVNVGVLTTGFDAPHVDMIVCLRATESPGLFYQIVGRGFRLAEGKNTCWILDYGGNIERHGPIDSAGYGMDTIKVKTEGGEAPQRVCPDCFTIQNASRRRCVECGIEFPEPIKEPLRATEAPVIAEPEWFDVMGATYYHNRGRELEDGTKKTDTLRVQYRCKADDGLLGKRWFSEWVCIEHEGFAGKKALEWWRKHSNNEFPSSVSEALEIIDNIGIGIPQRIEVVRDGKWDRVTDHDVDLIPEAQPLDWGESDDIPF